MNGGGAKRARGHPVVTSFQDLCLGAPLFEAFFCYCHLNAWRETQQKQDAAGRNNELCGPLSQNVTGLLLSRKLEETFRRSAVTLPVSAIRGFRDFGFLLYTEQETHTHSTNSGRFPKFSITFKILILHKNVYPLDGNRLDYLWRGLWRHGKK